MEYSLLQLNSLAMCRRGLTTLRSFPVAPVNIPSSPTSVIRWAAARDTKVVVNDHRCPSAFRILAVLVSMWAASGVSAQVFHDVTFSPTYWSSPIILVPPSDAGFMLASSSQASDLGHPSYRRTVLEYQAATSNLGSIFAAHLRSGTEVVLSSSERIDSVSYSYDLRTFGATSNGMASSGRAVAYAILLVQEGTYYRGPWDIVFQSLMWSHFGSQNPLTSADFVRLSGSGPQHPDFGCGASPVSFGYLTGNSTNTWQQSIRFTTTSGLDSWFVSVAVSNCDGDVDGVPDSQDMCPATIPDTMTLNPNQWGWFGPGPEFTQGKPKKGTGGSGGSYSMFDTQGCSCTQIVNALGLGAGHLQKGCSNSAMADWMAYLAAGKRPAALQPSEVSLPTEYTLYDAYPNPFNPQTTIGFELPEATHISLVVYDAMGRRVRVLATGFWTAGRHAATLESGRLPSGTYFVQLITPTERLTRTVQLAK